MLFLNISVKKLLNCIVKKQTLIIVHFNNIFRGENSTGLWSTKGCVVDTAASNETHSVCKCDHLTNFAVLMQIKPDSDLEVNHVIMY